MRIGIGGSSMGIGGGVGVGSSDNTSYSGSYGGPNSNGVATVPIVAATGSASGSIGSGQASLLLLDAAIIGLIVFYLWTHSVQRGG